MKRRADNPDNDRELYRDEHISIHRDRWQWTVWDVGEHGEKSRIPGASKLHNPSYWGNPLRALHDACDRTASRSSRDKLEGYIRRYEHAVKDLVKRFNSGATLW